MEPIEVTARFDQSGKIRPVRFTWQAREILVEGTGRRWETEGSVHILVLARGGQVFELVFRKSTATWWIIVPGKRPSLA